MKYWIIIDGVQKGPLTFEEVAALPGLSTSTPVWHEGLSDWSTAASVPEIAAILPEKKVNTAESNNYQQSFNQNNPNGGYNNPYAGNPYAQNHYGQNQYGYNQFGQQPFGQNQYGFNRNDNDRPPMPDTYLVWAILATICCCIPTGIVAIIYAAKVSPAYYRGDYMASVDASSKAQLWVIISFVAGLIWAPFSVLFSSLF